MEAPTIDLRALLVEREDCDAGTVQKLRDGLAQGGNQFKALKDVGNLLQKKLEASPPAMAKKLHLKLGIASYFLGLMPTAIENLRQVESALGFFYLGRAYVNKQQYDEAMKAFEKAEKAGYAAPQVHLQRASVMRLRGDLEQARQILAKLTELTAYSAEYHYQLGCLHLAEGDKLKAFASLEKAMSIEPGHTGTLFQLAYYNDLAGNDDDAITYYERCLRYPPVNRGVLNNLGILYEDIGRFEKAAECFNKLIKSDPEDERAKLFYRDTAAAVSFVVEEGGEIPDKNLKAMLETPVTDFELSVRARNCLKRMGIRTLGDLTRSSEANLLASKNFGETSLEEIRKIMDGRGLRMGQSLEQGSTHFERFRSQPQLSPEEQALLSRPVTDLNLSVRARKCMTRLQINSLGDLVSRSADELLESKNFGQTSLGEVREKLGQINMKLRGE